MKNLYLSLICALVCMASFSGCKKENIPPVFNYQYKVVSLANREISFTADDIVAGMPHFWNFGDGQTSTEEKPVHRFADTGSYVVSLKINGSDINKVSKTIRVFSDSGVTGTICHSWLCSHSYSQYIAGIVDTSITYPDISISIEFVDPVTVTIGTDTLIYDPSHSDAGTVSYFVFHPYPSYNWLRYNIGGSIRYEKYHHYSAAGGEWTVYSSL